MNGLLCPKCMMHEKSTYQSDGERRKRIGAVGNLRHFFTSICDNLSPSKRLVHDFRFSVRSSMKSWEELNPIPINHC